MEEEDQEVVAAMEAAVEVLEEALIECHLEAPLGQMEACLDQRARSRDHTGLQQQFPQELHTNLELALREASRQGQVLDLEVL